MWFFEPNYGRQHFSFLIFCKELSLILQGSAVRRLCLNFIWVLSGSQRRNGWS